MPFPRVMSKRTVLLATILAVVTTVVFWFLFGTGNYITFERYNMIEVGMTRQQVEAILGGPARSEVVDPKNPNGKRRVGPIKPADEWSGREGVISVFFSRDVVIEKDFHEHYGEVIPAPCPIFTR